MYEGKRIAVGDIVYIFASENEGGHGLIARGIAKTVEVLPRPPGLSRHTPRVSVAVERNAKGVRPLGRRELKSFGNWNDGQPQTELNFKLYRQATDKIVGISLEAATYLDALIED